QRGLQPRADGRDRLLARAPRAVRRGGVGPRQAAPRLRTLPPRARAALRRPGRPLRAARHRPGARTRARGVARGRVLAGLLLAGGVLMATTGSEAHGAPYEVDTARSEIAVVVFKGGAASMLAHDHVVRAARWQATLDVSVD